jgi:RHS repeat-associated protein
VDEGNPTGLSQVVEEIVGGAVKGRYTYGLERISQTQGGVTSYYGYDGHGDVRFLMDGTGTVTDTYDYDAWGNVVASTGSTPNVYMYQAEALDSETGLYYLRARYYDPLAGRFLSVDPMADEGEHPYTYAGADPVNGHDPTGTQTIIEYALLLRSLTPLTWPSFHINSCLLTLSIGTGSGPGGTLAGLTACQSSQGTGSGAAGKSGTGSGGAGPARPEQNPKIGIGVEVPKASAVNHGVLNLFEDLGHTIVYFKDAPGTIVSLLSFGPGEGGVDASDAGRFLKGQLSGNAHWPITGTLSTWESNITSDQLTQGTHAIANFKAHVPHYTPTFNCTSAALSIAAGIGIGLPNGVGPVVYRPRYSIALYKNSVANPYALSQQMTANFGPPDHADASSFPVP